MMVSDEFLVTDIYGARNLFADGERTGALFAVLDGAGELRPERVLGKLQAPHFEPAKLVPRVTRAALAPPKYAHSPTMVNMSLRRDKPELEYQLSGREGLFAFHMKCALASVTEAHCALLRAIAMQVDPVFARAHDDTDMRYVDERRGGTLGPQRFDPDDIDEVYWWNVWGPKLVEKIGRQRILSTPAYRVELLPYGGVLVQLAPLPLDYASADARRAQARALAHLHPDRSESEIFDQLMARSRYLAPVERTWHPDLAELFELVVNDTVKPDRQREVERLNAYRPPPVTERRDPPLPADVDVDDTVEHYGDLAERLVALVRERVPLIESNDPAVLPQLDHHLWNFDYATKYERANVDKLLVPALGAYVGELMVATLGGRWVPRAELDESQVVVGGVAYLPFLRACHALATQQAQIDASMTQFYREAARAGSRRSGHSR